MPTTETKPTPSATTDETGTSQRLMSVDALRGFDMFWIIGADALVAALNRMSRSKPTEFLASQLDHANWEGFRFYDLIFPLFVFMVGVSLVFSLTKTIERAGRVDALKRVFVRSLLLFALGLFYSGGLTNRWPDIRLMGVLNRIALAYFFAGLLFCFFRPRALAAICLSLLLGYWALLAFTPIRTIQLDKNHLVAAADQQGDSESAESVRRRGNPSSAQDRTAWGAAEKIFYATTNYVAGKDAVSTNRVVTETASGSVTNYVVAHYPMGFNLANHLDFKYLPARKYDTFWDPEGLLSTIPAVATCLLGVFAGLLLRSRNYCDRWKVTYLLSLGAAAVLAGWLWHLEFPVIKKIWTSSYVLVAGGYSAMLLGAFYLVVDVWKRRTWCQPFVWMGMNSITIYLVGGMIGEFTRPASRLVGGDVNAFLDAHVAKGFGELMVTIVGLLLAFWFVRFLYKNKIFIRV